MGVPREPIHPSHLPWRRGHHLPQGRRRGRERRRSPRTRSRQTKLRRGPGSPFCLVEQGYGVCGARDERAHAGQQQQLVDQLGHDVLPRSGSGKTTTGSRNFGSASPSPPDRERRGRAGCGRGRRTTPRRFRLMVKRGPDMRPQASEGEAQHGLLCWTRCVGKGNEGLHRG